MDLGSEDSRPEVRSKRGYELVLEGYEIGEVVGRGAFGIVYRAREVAFDRGVAVKLLTAPLDGESTRRFERECRYMGTVSGHPNIVTVYAAGTDEWGRAYLIMELMTHGSLADRLGEQGARPFRWQRALDIGVKLAGALETAHRAGILHRDMKPENVLVSPYGDPKLGDFGISRAHGSYITRSGLLHATPLHAPPEVLNGKRATEASDVYSLGSTIFNLIAGKAPFAGDEDDELYALFYRVTSTPLPDLRPYGAPDKLCTVLERATAKNPMDRYPSANAFGEDLRKVQKYQNLPVTEMAVLRDAAAAPVDPSPEPGPPLRPAAALDGTSTSPARQPPPPPAPQPGSVPAEHPAPEPSAPSPPSGERRTPIRFDFLKGPDRVTRVVPRSSRPATGPAPGSSASDTMRGLRIEVEAEDLVVDPGSDVATNLRIVNTGSFPDTFEVRLVGLPDEWVSIQPPRISLGVGSSGNTAIGVRPPRQHTTRPGRWPFEVLVWSEATPNVRCSERRTLTIARFRDAEARLGQVTGSEAADGVHELVVMNRGNAPLTAVVDPGETDSRLQVVCEVRDLSVGPGDTVRSEVRVVPKQRLYVGKPVRYVVRLVLRSEGEPLVAEVPFTQHPSLRTGRGS